MIVERWIILINALYDDGGKTDEQQVKGPCLAEWCFFIHHDWDDVDRMLLDMETIGGG